LYQFSSESRALTMITIHCIVHCSSQQTTKEARRKLSFK